MDTEESELWHRLITEPERAFRAFECFLSLASDQRTLLAAYKLHVDNPNAVKPSAQYPQQHTNLRHFIVLTFVF